jgi:hypothetical protein
MHEEEDFKADGGVSGRMMVAMTVDQVKSFRATLKADLMENLPKWKQQAANPKNSERAKYQKMVAKAQIDRDAAHLRREVQARLCRDQVDRCRRTGHRRRVYAIARAFKQEQEQAAYDAHSLKGQLKQQLTTFVAIASKVNFNAPTVEKNRKTMFVNAADEKQGAIWKAASEPVEPATARREAREGVAGGTVDLSQPNVPEVIEGAMALAERDAVTHRAFDIGLRRRHRLRERRAFREVRRNRRGKRAAGARACSVPRCAGPTHS